MSRLFGYFLTFACLFMVVGCTQSTSSTARKKIVVDSFVLEDYVNDLIGGEAELIFPVPDGVSPEDWKPTSADIALIQSADLILLNGGSTSEWSKSASVPAAKTVDTSAAYKDKMISVEEGVAHVHGDGQEHKHTGVLGTTWFDRELAFQQLEATQNALKKLLPGLTDTIDQNGAELENRMDITYTGIAGNCTNFKNHRFVGSHPVYHYFARSLGLNFSYVIWEPQNVPTAEQLEELKKLNPNVFVWEDTPNPEADKAVQALNIETIVLRPLSGKVKDSYFSKELKKNNEALKQLYFLYKNNKAKNKVSEPEKSDEKKAAEKSDEKKDEKAEEKSDANSEKKADEDK
jgi:zinc transport system substrate-binding protein